MMRTANDSQRNRLKVLTLKSMTLLATVAACGRTSGGSEQQLLDLAAKSASRLKAANPAVGDTLAKRNVEATERLLRGLIDKEREERMAEDKRLGDRIDALEIELRSFREQVDKRFESVSSRDQVLRIFMEGQFEILRDADKKLAKSLSDVDREFASRIGANEIALKESLAKQNDILSEVLSTKAALADFQMQVAREKAVLERSIIDSKSSLASEMKSLIKQTAEENRVAWQKSIDAVAAEAKGDAAKNSAVIDLLRSKSQEIVEQIASTNANLAMTNSEIARVKDQMLAKIEQASNRSAAELKAVADQLVTKMVETDSKMRADLESRIDKTVSQSAESLAAATMELTSKMKFQSVETQIKMAALTEQIVKVDSEGNARAANLETKISQDISNIRGEFTAKVAALDAAVQGTREALSKKIDQGLSSISSVMESKLSALDGKISDKLKNDLARINTNIALLEGRVGELDQSFSAKLSESMLALRNESGAALIALGASLTSKIDSGNALLKARIDGLIDAQKTAEAENIRRAAEIHEKIAQQQASVMAYIAGVDQKNRDDSQKLFASVYESISKDKSSIEGILKAFEGKIELVKADMVVALSNEQKSRAAELAEQKLALELEKTARAAELSQLSTDLSTLNAAQVASRAKLEADLKEAMKSQVNASAEEIAALKASLEVLDGKTLATVDDLKKGLANSRLQNEIAILNSTRDIEAKLANAAIETQKVAARVEAVYQAQEEFKAYVAKNYATKGELLALQQRLSGLEEVSKIMNSDIIRSNAEIKTLISAEIAAVTASLTSRVQSVEANVSDVRSKLGGAIDDYQKQISLLKDNMSRELSAVRDDMKTQDSALFASIVDNKAKQDSVNADLMLGIKKQAADFENLSQKFKIELSEKLVSLEGRIDQTNSNLKAEFSSVQKKFAEVVAAEQTLKDQLTNEMISLKNQMIDVAKIANQSMVMAQQNAEQINLVKGDLAAQKKYVENQFKLTQGQLDLLNTKLDDLKNDFNKRLSEIAINSEKLVENLGSEVKENFKKTSTRLAQLRAQERSMEGTLSSHLFEVVNLKVDEAIASAFSDNVVLDLRQVLKLESANKVTKGPLINTLEMFAELRRNFLQALQPKLPTRTGESINRNEAFDVSFVPLMTACGGRADADFANAFGRDSFDFLADEYISNLIYSNRGSNIDVLFFKQPKLTDGTSLHHYVMIESLRKLEGGADNPQCLSSIKSWAANILNGSDSTSKDVRARLSGHEGFKRAVTDFANAVASLKEPVNAVELRFAKMIHGNSSNISQAMTNMTNVSDKLGKVPPAEAATTLLGKLAFTLTEAVDVAFDRIQREIEFGNIVDIQKRFASNEGTLAKQKDRLTRIDADVAVIQSKLAEFGKTASDVKALQESTGQIEASLSKALDVLLSLAIKSGAPELVQATKAAAAEIGYSPQEVRAFKPQISEVQHFFSAPALANSSDTCTGSSIKRGAGVKFWHSQGSTQCWVNFRGIPVNQWASASGTIWFRLFGAADKIRMRSKLCDKGPNSSCDAEFKFQFNSNAATSTVNGLSAKLVGQPSEGVFDFRMPSVLEPYLRSKKSWDGETLEFVPYSGTVEGSAKSYSVQLYSPIVLDFKTVGRPMLTSFEESGVRFDLNGDGVKERTGWVGGFGGVGFLALDLNGNGTVDSGLELFGEGTKLAKSGRKARDGYQALAQYDDNHDGVIDAKDQIFKKLVVWFDKNKDGQTDAGEVVSLASTGVTKVSLNYTNLKDAGRFIKGNEMRTTAKFWGPSECGKAGCNSYDVYFSTAFLSAAKEK